MKRLCDYTRDQIDSAVVDACALAWGHAADDLDVRTGDQGQFVIISLCLTSREDVEWDEYEAFGRLVVSATREAGWWTVEAHAASGYESTRDDAVIRRYEAWPVDRADLDRTIARWLRDADRRLTRRYRWEYEIRPVLRGAVCRAMRVLRNLNPARVYDNARRASSVRVLRRCHWQYPDRTQEMARLDPSRVGGGLVLVETSFGRRAVFYAQVGKGGAVWVRFRARDTVSGQGDESITIPRAQVRRELPRLLTSIVEWDVELTRDDQRIRDEYARRRAAAGNT